MLLELAIVFRGTEGDHQIVLRCVSQTMSHFLAEKIARGARRELAHLGRAIRARVVDEC